MSHLQNGSFFVTLRLGEHLQKEEEMCCILAIKSREPVFVPLVFGLIPPNPTAKESCGIAIGERLLTAKGLVLHAFNNLKAEEFPGTIGLGHIACANGAQQPIKLINGHISIDATAATVAKIVEIMDQCEDVEEGVRTVLDEVRNYFALVIVTHEGRIVATRNSKRMTLAYGEGANGYVGMYVATQTNSLGLEGRYVSSVPPGAILIIENDVYDARAINIVQATDVVDQTSCLHRVIWGEHPSGYSCGEPIAEIRRRLGHALARKIMSSLGIADEDRDWIAIPVPFGANSFIPGFENANLSVNPAAAIKSNYPPNDQIEPCRNYHPYNLIDSKDYGVRNRKVILVDDTAMSGTTAKEMVERCRDRGASEVYLATAALISHTCPHGKDVKCSRRFLISSSSIKRLGLDGIFYLTYQELTDIINYPGRRQKRVYCRGCTC